jgi:hypothetical protein
MKNGKILIAIIITLMLLICVAQGGSIQKAEEIPTVDYCELLRNPEKYDKKTIRVTALLVRGFEVSAFENPVCDTERSTWVEFDPASRQRTKKEIQKEFDRVYNPPRKRRKGVIEIPGPERAELTVAGQFNGPKPGIPIGPEGKRVLTGYGHLNGFKYQFIIKCIEQVKPAPWK